MTQTQEAASEPTPVSSPSISTPSTMPGAPMAESHTFPCPKCGATTEVKRGPFGSFESTCPGCGAHANIRVPAEPGVRFVDQWDNRYDKCPICGRAHRDAHALAACQARHHAAWQRAKADGLRSEDQEALTLREEYDLRREQGV